MLRKNKHYSRSYLFAYLAWLFGCWIPPMLFSKDAGGLSIVFVVLDCLILAALITSHVFKNTNKDKLFYPVALPALGLICVLSVLGLIMELVFTLQGIPAPWPWIAGGFSTAMSILCGVFFYFGYRRMNRLEEAI